MRSSIVAGSRSRRGARALLLASSALLLGACGGGGGSTAPGSEDAIETLRIDVLSQPSTLDPIALNDPPAQRVWRLVYDSLLDWDEDTTEVVPKIASDLPTVGEDGLTYTIPIRDDVTWHDGTPLTVDDVVFTYQQVKDPDNASVWAGGIAALDDVTALDATTVQFTLSKQYTYLPEKMAMIPIIPASGGYEPNGELARTMLGTGPFVFEEWREGQSITLSRNDDYYDTAAGVESVEFHVVPEDATRIANLRNGTTHLAPDLSPALIDTVNGGGARAEVVEENSTRIYLYPNMQEGRPTADADLRQAIASAVDRKAIVDTVYAGAARSASTYLSYGSRYHDEELGLYYGDGADVTATEEFLTRAPQLDRPLNLVVNNLPALVDAATIVQRSLQEAGIEVELEPLDFSALNPRLMGHEYDILLTQAPVSVSAGFAPDYPAIGLTSTSVPNWNRFSNSEMDALLAAATEAAPGEESAAAWRAVQELDITTLGQIQLVSAQYVEGIGASVGDGYAPSKLAWLHNVPTIGTD